MKSFLIALPLLALPLASCDKAKETAKAVREKIQRPTDSNAPPAPGGEVSDELAAQIDSAAEGHRFRRDLEFPLQVEVILTERTTFHQSRVFSKSEIGENSGTIDGTLEKITRLTRTGAHLAYEVRKDWTLLEVEAKSEADQAKGKSVVPAPLTDHQAGGAPAGTVVEFLQQPTGEWRLRPQRGAVDFKRQALAEGLMHEIGTRLQDCAIMPRAQWFSPHRRWSTGDQILLEDGTLELLFPGSTKGKATLTFEMAEAQDGHPCARFSVVGEVEAGGKSGENLTLSIQSGKVWCSLLHPLVLREEYQTVQTHHDGQGRGPKQRMQGKVDLLRVVRWRPTDGN